jgi:hypothetical protein
VDRQSGAHRPQQPGVLVDHHGAPGLNRGLPLSAIRLPEPIVHLCVRGLGTVIPIFVGAGRGLPDGAIALRSLQRIAQCSSLMQEPRRMPSCSDLMVSWQTALHHR